MLVVGEPSRVAHSPQKIFDATIEAYGTNEGIIIRLAVDTISEMSRVTQGVRLINLREGQKVSSISIVEKDEDDDLPVDTQNTVDANNVTVEETSNENNE